MSFLDSIFCLISPSLFLNPAIAAEASETRFICLSTGDVEAEAGSGPFLWKRKRSFSREAEAGARKI